MFKPVQIVFGIEKFEPVTFVIFSRWTCEIPSINLGGINEPPLDEAARKHILRPFLGDSPLLLRFQDDRMKCGLDDDDDDCKTRLCRPRLVV